MSTSPELCIIVPLYNVATFVEQLVKALEKQDASQIEILFINDGSTDKTVDALELALKNANLAAPWQIFHKPNGGLSDARNFGLARTAAPFVTFLDPDDTISDSYYKTLLRRIKETGAPIALSASEEIWSDGRRKAAAYYDSIIETSGDLSWMFRYDWSACTKVFSRSLFTDETFDVGLRYEDLALVPHLVTIAGQMCISSDAVYYYHRREDSITLDRDFEKEKEIFRALDKMYDRLRVSTKQDLFWAVMQKVLVLGFIPSVTKRYSAKQSRTFAYMIRDYMASHAPDNKARSYRPTDLLTSALLIAPASARWIITALYILANRVSGWIKPRVHVG